MQGEFFKKRRFLPLFFAGWVLGVSLQGSYLSAFCTPMEEQRADRAVRRGQNGKFTKILEEIMRLCLNLPEFCFTILLL
jgi:hypothetical protein